MLIDYLALAFKNVRKRGIRSWLTMLGVFIGIAAVVSLISLGQGLESAIIGQFGALSVDTLTIQGADTGFAPPGSAAVRKMSNEELELAEEVSGVEIVIPRLLRPGEIEFNDRIGFGYFASIPQEKEQVEEVYKTLNLEAEQGRLIGENDFGEIVLGNDYVKQNTYNKQIRVGSKLKVEGKDFKVVGILERSSSFTFNSAILMMEDDMRTAFDIPNEEYDFIAVKVEDPDEINEVADEISRKLRRLYSQDEGEEDFEVQTPEQSLDAVKTILNVVNVVVTGIALIALLVGGIGIANTMFTSVLERTKEIGVMKAIGARNSDILTVFLTEAGMLGLVGGIIGAIIGILMALLASLIANSALGNDIFILNFSVPLISGAIAFALFIGILSGIIPALQASKLKPVDALRK